MIVGTANGLVIGRALGLAEAAMFSQANKIASIVRNVFYYSLMRPVLPGLTTTQQAGDSIAPLYLRIIETVTGIAWPTYLVMSIWAGPLVLLLYGPKWVMAGALVPTIALSQALPHAITPHYEVLIVKRRVGTLFLSEAGLAAVPILFVPIGALVSLQAAACALIVQSLCFVGWYYYLLKPIVGFTAKSLVKTWGRSLALTAAVGVTTGAVRLITPDHHPIQILVGLAASGILGGLAWLAVIWLTRHEFARHLDVLLHQARSWIMRPKFNT
jgi:O-antigen/teichoic acid export membrane protein